MIDPLPILSDNTPIKGKYTTIGEVKNANINSAKQVIARMPVSPEKEHLSKWLFETYYLKEEFFGNLTTRTKKISTKTCHNHIISHCFDGINPLEYCESIPILTDKCKSTISSLHKIDAPGCGMFMDYLIRRLISEIRTEPFVDTRANKILDQHTKTEETKFSCYNIYGEFRECKFPQCQIKCYTKVKDTNHYKTKDILKELYIVSCCHSECFGTCPSQSNFDKIINILDKLDTIDNFLEPLIKLCETILKNSKNVLLNPGLGTIEYPIPSDCDIVIDGILIDLKCTKGMNEISEQLQLLGYASLLKYNKEYGIRINHICIINLLQGELKVYNIQNILDENLLEYLQLLSNQYNPDKQTIKRIYNAEIVDCIEQLRNESRKMKNDFEHDEPKEFEKMTIPELKKICSERGLSKYKTKKKQELIDLLKK